MYMSKSQLRHTDDSHLRKTVKYEKEQKKLHKQEKKITKNGKRTVSMISKSDLDNSERSYMEYESLVVK